MSQPGKPGQDAGDFLARWSQRKLEARREDAGPGAQPEEMEPLPGVADAGTGQPEPPVRELTDADMPAIETLDAESDYAAFMSPGVSDGLRRLALRKLFKQPDFNVTDGLNDYDHDYTRFASLGSVVTHEMKRMLLRELQGRPAESPPADVPAAESLAAAAAEPVPERVPPVTADTVVADAGNEAPAASDARPEDKTI